MGVPDKVVLHPLVLLSVVDHYNRVARDTKKRVVGLLLGDTYKGQVDVTNSFAVPFEEDDHDPTIWFLDHSYLENMFHMFKKVNGEDARAAASAVCDRRLSARARARAVLGASRSGSPASACRPRSAPAWNARSANASDKGRRRAPLAARRPSSQTPHPARRNPARSPRARRGLVQHGAAAARG
jgi:hypothetical protein